MIIIVGSVSAKCVPAQCLSETHRISGLINSSSLLFPFSLSLSLVLCFFLSLSVCLSVCLCVSVSLYVCLACISGCLSVCMPTCLHACLSLSVCLSVYFCLSVSPSVPLSILSLSILSLCVDFRLFSILQEIVSRKYFLHYKCILQQYKTYPSCKHN